MMSEDKWTNLATYFLEHKYEIIHKLTDIIITAMNQHVGI